MLINGWVAFLNTPTRINFRLLVALLMLFPASGHLVVTAAETLPVGAITFESHVRPILKANCFHCHGEGDKLQSGLDLRLRRFIVKGGETGPAIVPGKPAESTLLDYLREGEMPPPEVEKRLTPNEIAVVERWIADGAKTAGVEPDKIDSGFYVTQQERDFWSFQPLVRHVPPPVKQQHRVRTPIDQFVLVNFCLH